MAEPDDETETDTDPDAAWLRDLSRAAAWLTVLWRDPADASPAVLAKAARACPVIGISLGVVAAAAYGIGDGLGFYGLASAALALGLVAAMTGARGEGGAAAFVSRLGRGDGEERPTADAGLILAVFGIVLRIGLVAAVSFASSAAAILIAAVTVSRIAMPLAAGWGGALAPSDAAGGDDDAAPGRRLWVVALVGFLLLILFLGLWGAVVSAILAAGAAVAVVAAAGRTGGLDRPALWAVQQGVEIAILAGAVATL